MTLHPIPYISFGCALLLSTGPRSLLAQADTSLGSRQIEASCRRAKTTLPQGATRDDKVNRVIALQECGDEGVEKLRELWSETAEDSEVVTALADVSARVNDRRLYQAARSAFLDQDRPEAVRLKALSVLVAGYDPRMAVAFPEPTTPMRTNYVSLGRTSHTPTKKGPQPVGAEARADLLTTLDQVATSDRSERIRKVSQELVHLLRARS